MLNCSYIQRTDGQLNKSSLGRIPEENQAEYVQVTGLERTNSGVVPPQKKKKTQPPPEKVRPLDHTMYVTVTCLMLWALEPKARKETLHFDFIVIYTYVIYYHY